MTYQQISSSSSSDECSILDGEGSQSPSLSDLWKTYVNTETLWTFNDTCSILA